MSFLNLCHLYRRKGSLLYPFLADNFLPYIHTYWQVHDYVRNNVASLFSTNLIWRDEKSLGITRGQHKSYSTGFTSKYGIDTRLCTFPSIQGIFEYLKPYFEGYVCYEYIFKYIETLLLKSRRARARHDFQGWKCVHYLLLREALT